MTTYYYGIVEFGKFSVGAGEPTPLAIIHRVNEVKEFDRPAEAWEHWVNSNGGHESYIGLDAKDENNVQYDIVFKQHR
jgi:hypothetical protein